MSEAGPTRVGGGAKALAIATKTLKESFRQPKNLGITLGLPLAFMLIFGLAFGSSAQETYDIALLDQDEGEVSDGYVEALRALEYADGTRLFDVTTFTDEAAARDALREGRHAALVILPANFSENAVPQGSPPPGGPVPPLTQPQQGPPPVEGAIALVVGDPSRQQFQIASQIVAAFTADFSKAMSASPPAVDTRTESVAAAELTAFDFIAPGLMVFAVLNMVPQAAATLARETETRTLDRLRMSPTSTASILGGVALAQLAFACVSLALMLVTARLMGFHNQGSYVWAYAVALAAALAVTGIGMIVAAFARTQQEAGNFGALVSVPASFLSGAFFAIPGVALWGDVELYDLLPTTHAVDALRQIMTFGRGVEAVTGALAALAGLSIVFFAIGGMLYRRTRLRAD